MPAIKLTGAKSGTRPARKSAAKQTPTRSRKPAAKAKAAAATASTNGAATRGPKLPDGWTQRDFNSAVKDMQKAKAAREAAEDRLKEAQEAANGMALELLQEGVQMSVISTELELSRQWLYTLMEKNGITPARAKSSKPAARSTRTTKPAAKKRPAAKSKPAAKRSAPARKRPASKPVAATGRGRVRIR